MNISTQRYQINTSLYLPATIGRIDYKSISNYNILVSLLKQPFSWLIWFHSFNPLKKVISTFFLAMYSMHMFVSCHTKLPQRSRKCNPKRAFCVYSHCGMGKMGQCISEKLESTTLDWVLRGRCQSCNHSAFTGIAVTEGRFVCWHTDESNLM